MELKTRTKNPKPTTARYEQPRQRGGAQGARRGARRYDDAETFDDGVIPSVAIAAVDDEGVLHSGPDGIRSAHYWTQFESISEVEPRGL